MSKIEREDSNQAHQRSIAVFAELPTWLEGIPGGRRDGSFGAAPAGRICGKDELRSPILTRGVGKRMNHRRFSYLNSREDGAQTAFAKRMSYYYCQKTPRKGQQNATANR